MAVKLLRLSLLLVLFCLGRAKKQRCPTSASSCDECIQSGPECAWCTAPHSHIRCHTMKGLQRAGCLKHFIHNPQGGVLVVRNGSSTEPVKAASLFLRPQEVALRLRPGVSQSFPVTITMPTDQQATELTVDTSPVPAGVNITFSILNRNPVVLQVNVEAAQCPSETDVPNQMQNRTGPWSVHLTPRGSSLSVKLDLTLQCQCDCTGNREENSRDCSGNGALECGKCECYQTYVGQHCQRNADLVSSSNDDACRSGPNDPVCSGRGECREGYCECSYTGNPEETYSGRFCECANFDCPRVNNKLCGGHGRCICGDCVCEPDWTGEECACSMETASCMASNQMLCNGRGNCECGMCVCSQRYVGPTCEECPTCLGKCALHAECVECRAFGTGAKTDRCELECSYLNVTMVETKHDITGQRCRMSSREDSCIFEYGISSTPAGLQSTVARFKVCRRS